MIVYWLKIVAINGISNDRLEFCLAEILKVAGSSMQVEFRFVDEIPLTKSGKYRVTISEIAAA